MALICQNTGDGNVRRIDIPLSRPVRRHINGWTLVWSLDIVELLSKKREERLPKETGGVLIGYFDALRKSIYIVDILSAPSDSLEQSCSFVRGYTGLAAELQEIDERTGGQVRYIGEWHSHPTSDISMSELDRRLLESLADEMCVEGWPGVMAIIGADSTIGMYINSS